MNKEELNAFARQEANAWYRVGWSTLNSAYRKYQADRHGVPDLIVPKPRRDAQAAQAAYLAVAGVLARQVANGVGGEYSEVLYAVLNRLYELCGTPEAPKHLREWAE